MKEGNFFNIILVVVLVVSLSLLFFENVDALTGHVTEGSTVSNVSISQYFSIEMSEDLENGIYFGDIDQLPAINQNATKNYNGTSNSTLYFVKVSTDSNSNVSFCIMANQGMENSGGDIMDLANETYSNSTAISDLSNPNLADDVSLSSVYTSAGSNVGIGDALYYRFWLDVPVSQPTGVYNNSVFIKGINLGASC